MLKRIFSIRILFIVIITFTFLNSVVFIILGVLRSIKGYFNIVEGISHKEFHNPGLILGESLDSFLIAIVFLIFAFGIYKLFVFKETDKFEIPKWANVKNLSELKFLMWESIIITLVVMSIVNIMESVHHLNWTNVILPTIVLILSIGYFVIKKSE